MDILNALKQLRDDLKTWVTNNINALNVKINSINDSVGDTPVATQISQAINEQELSISKTYQPKLTVGTGISISEDGTISLNLEIAEEGSF